MPFHRQPSLRWHREVPGTRWFKADLHLHTLDDHPDGRLQRPPGLNGDATDPAVLRAYARCFLRAAIARNVEVLGLAPHDVRTGPKTSAVWTIVEVWNSEEDDDGVPFRDKIRAVFPGFEPSLNVGSNEVHFVFLFDPEIGRQRFMRLFDALMAGISPWDRGTLQMTRLNPDDVFRTLDDFHKRENAELGTVDRWDCVAMAPHAFSPKGLFHGAKSQILQLFPSDRLAAIELGGNGTPEQAEAKRSWLRPNMRRLRHAYCHASDAYGFASDPSSDELFEIGSRCTLLKLSNPRIEALRQAFLGEASRLRLMYHRDAAGRFGLRTDLPKACPAGPDARPWLRELKIAGGTSFHRGQTFRLSPDLTCIIGGGMTGKSTLLDGLRLTMLGEAGLPTRDKPVRALVETRARTKFLSGNPQVDLESPVGDPTVPVPRRFTMRFFSQGELKSLADDPDGIEHLLFHLVPGRAGWLITQREELGELDERLVGEASKLTRLQDTIGEAEQAVQRAQQARQAMERFAQAGTAKLPPAQRDVARTKNFAQGIRDRSRDASELAESLRSLGVPEVQAPEIAGSLATEPCVAALLGQARQHAASAAAAIGQLQSRADRLEASARARHQDLLTQVQRALVTAGGSPEDLNTFDACAKAAQHYDSFKAVLDGKIAERRRLQERFHTALQEREQLVSAHRTALAAVCAEVRNQYDQRVNVTIEEEGRREALGHWVKSLRRPGLSRWWNSGASGALKATAFRSVLAAIADGRPADAKTAALTLGMSAAVSDRLLEVLASEARRLDLHALRCPDRYRLQWVEAGVAKDLDQLSGGRKVAVLLALLLESDDQTPLVVDQPEDELDNRFLNETIIPALHRLKGKRQVILATHNANIVVNGDADRVIALEADADYGRVYAEGAIEDPEVREAILKTLDGGMEAFRLRRAKYGF